MMMMENMALGSALLAQLTSSATTYILTTKIDWRRKRFAPVLFAADFRFVP
jgi:hypothetical protein